MKQLKRNLKKAHDFFWDFLFHYEKLYPILKYYPKGRNHLYDILIEEGTNKNFVVFDVGANVGQSSIYYNRVLREPKIYAFEPINGTYSKLLQNTKRLLNFKTFNFALGSESKSIEVKLAKDSGINSMKSEVFDVYEQVGAQLVEVKTLDVICASIGVDRINILKIDTEGYDLEVLKGAVTLLNERRIDYVYCEVSFNGEPNKGDFFEINKFLRKYDFWLCGFYEPSRWGRNFTYLSFHNALFKKVKE